MDHFFSDSTGVLSLSMPLSANSGEGSQPLLKSTTLSRLDELQQYLKQCDDQQYKRRYFKMLSSCPTDVLDDYAKQLKNRAAWLASEESREYKRAKLLNVMGDPLKPVTSADADAFCTKVLEDCFTTEDCVTPQFDSKAQYRACEPVADTSEVQNMSDTDRSGCQVRVEVTAKDTSLLNGAASCLSSPIGGRGNEGAAGIKSPPMHVSVLDHHLQRTTPLQDSLIQQRRHKGCHSPSTRRLSPMRAEFTKKI